MPVVVVVAIKAATTQTVLGQEAVAITHKMHKVLIKVTADQAAAEQAATLAILTLAAAAPAVLLQ